MLNRPALLGIACLLSLFVGSARGADPSMKLIDVRKIWDEGAHNAFTDLLHHNGAWYCVFREGKGHVSQDGGLRVLTSRDGQQWVSAALVTLPGTDLRDPKISVSPDGKLCLCGAGAWHRPKESETELQSYLWYSKDGQDWGEAIPIGDRNHWIWRIVWRKTTGYGIGYTKAEDNLRARLYQTTDGRDFTVLVPNMLPNQGYVNETAVLFLPDETALCLIRRDGRLNEALLGTASAPYTDWTFQTLGTQVGGPQMLQLPDGRIIVAGRRYPGGAKTQLWWLDPATATLTEALTLPSGGDTSYPGLVFHEGKLWVSYYSSHAGKTSIYLAQVELP